MGRTAIKSRGKGVEPYKRNSTAGTNSVSNRFPPSIRKIYSQKLRTSFFDHCCRGVLKNPLILSRWYRSKSLLAFSDPFFLTCLSVRPTPGLAALCAYLRAGSKFTTVNVTSSSFATSRIGQLVCHVESKWRKPILTP